MIAKKFRLPIKNLSARAEKIINNPYSVFKIYSNQFGFNRFGIIAGRKFDRHSTKRNLWRRRFLAILREWPNFAKDFLIILNPKLKDLSFRELRKELDIIKTKIQNTKY